MLRFLEARAIRGLEAIEDGTYARTIEIDGVHGLVFVRPGKGHALKVTVRFPKLSALPTIIARLRRVFDLSADPHAIGAQLSEDPALARLVSARPGLRVPGAWDGFELAVRAVLGQQVSVRAAVGLAGKIVAAHGDPLAAGGADAVGLTRVFPRPERLAGLDPAALPMPRSRATALVALARAVAADPHIFRTGRSLDEVVGQLRSMKGIGEWTAHYIAMRQLREPDAFPSSDLGLLRAMAGLDGRRPTARELLTRAERWRPWRAYAAQHLWMADAS